ncbi:MAG: hypothetical protein U0X20_03240 [Caldilineaceae bacterium]
MKSPRLPCVAQARPCGDGHSWLPQPAHGDDDDLSAMLGEMSYLLGPGTPVQIETCVAPYLQREYVAGGLQSPGSPPPIFTPRASASVRPSQPPPSP